jgi:hypothetical protein
VLFQNGTRPSKGSTFGSQTRAGCIDDGTAGVSATCCGVNLAAAWTELVASLSCFFRCRGGENLRNTLRLCGVNLAASPRRGRWFVARAEVRNLRGARRGSHAPTGEPIDWVVGQAALSATVQFQKGHETSKRSTSGLKPASICIDYEALVESATCCGVNLAASPGCSSKKGTRRPNGVLPGRTRVDLH